jgi:DNA-binding protein H-NS
MLNMLPKFDYATLSFTDLKAHRDEIDAILAEKLEAETAAFRDEIARKANSLGISPVQFFAPKSNLPARYRHPDDPSITWSGKGRAPSWLIQLEEQGRSREEFMVD